MNIIPKDVLYSIANNLDRQSFLSLSLCSKHLHTTSHEIAEQWYVEEGSHPYAINYGDENPGWMNLRIAILAKNAWRSKDNKIKPFKYKQIRPITIAEMGHYDPIKLKRSPVNLLSITPTASIFFSGDGCRLEEPQLNIIDKNPLRIGYITPLTKEFPKEKVGSVIAVLHNEGQWFLLSKVNSTISVVFIDFLKEMVNKIVDLKVNENEIACHHFHDGILTLGLNSGLLLRYSVTNDDISQISSHTFFRYITSAASLPNGDILVTSKEDPSGLSNLFKVDGVTKAVDMDPNLSGNLMAHADSIYLHTEKGELYESSIEMPTKFHLISTGVKKIWPLGSNLYLMQNKEHGIELKKHEITLTCLGDHRLIKAACWQEDMLAIVFEDGSLNIFEPRKSGANPIYTVLSTKPLNPSHDLQFSKTLELILTFNDGSIFTYLPFNYLPFIKKTKS